MSAIKINFMLLFKFMKDNQEKYLKEGKTGYENVPSGCIISLFFMIFLGLVVGAVWYCITQL